MKKHKLRNLIPGMLILALLVALAIPALAMTGQKQMTVDYMGIKISVDGVPAPIGTPLVSEGTTYLPVRAVGEALGKEVRWDGPTHTVYITDPTEANATTNSSAVYVDKSKKTIDVDYLDIRLVVDGKEVTPRDANGKVVEPFAYQGTTYLPVRAVGEALGKTVRWDGENKIVHLGEMPQGTYLVDVCKVASGDERLLCRAVDGYSFAMSDGKRYSQGVSFTNYGDLVTFELGGKYESLTFDLGFGASSVNSSRLQVYLDGELAQEIEAKDRVETVTVPLNYAQTVSFFGRSLGIANAVLNGERTVTKPVPPANATYLVDACAVRDAYKAAEEQYWEDMFGNQYTNGLYVGWGGTEMSLNGKYKTLKATVVNDIDTRLYDYLDKAKWSFLIDGEVVKEIEISNAMSPQTIEIPLNYGMKLEIENDHWEGDLFLADAILE